MEFWNSVVILLSYEVNPFFRADKISLIGNIYAIASKVLAVCIIKNLGHHFSYVNFFFFFMFYICVLMLI